MIDMSSFHLFFMRPTINVMKHLSLALIFSFSAAALLSGGDAPSSPAELRKAALAVVAPLPARMPGAERDTPEQIVLGRKLFNDNRLSINQSQSCNTCHRVDGGRGGVDNEAFSLGAHGKRGGRNAPTVLNAGLHIAQFWDGRADSLEAQAKGPVLNPVEMAMPNADEVVRRLKGTTNLLSPKPVTIKTSKNNNKKKHTNPHLMALLFKSNTGHELLFFFIKKIC